MGDMTRAQLLVQGGLAASQDEDVGTFIRDWLDNWLKRTAKSWSWPQLKFRVTTPATAGVAVVTVGKGNGGSSLHLHRLLGNYVFWYTADKRNRGRMLTRLLLDGDVDKDESATNASERLGSPDTCKVRVGDGGELPDGCFRIYPDPCPNVAVTFAFDAHIVPPALGSTEDGDDEVPWYPQDKTLQLAVKCAFMELDDGAEGKEAYDKEMMKLEAMAIKDRDTDGEAPGDNQTMMLDPSVFR